MANPSDPQNWKAILDVTDELGCEEVKALRVLLQMLLAREGKASVRSRVRSWYKLARYLLLPIKRILPESPSGNPLFAFIYDTAAHANNLAPVLSAASKKFPQISILTGERVTISQLGLDFKSTDIGFADLLLSVGWSARINALSESVRLWRLLRLGFQRKGPKLATIVNSHRSYVIVELALSIALRSALRQLFSKWKPSWLISTTDHWPFEYTLFSEARRARITSFVIQHGIVNLYWHPSPSDFLLLWGDSFRQELVSIGAEAQTLSVLGMPAADRLFSRYGQIPEPTAKKDSYSVLIFSQTHAKESFDGLFEKYREFLIQTILSCPEIKWCIKLHPSETEAFYQDMGPEVLERIVILPKSVTLEEAVNNCGIVCTLFSTAGLEAMIIGRPLVIFNLSAEIEGYAWWPKYGGGVYVSTSQSMKEFFSCAKVDVTFLSRIISDQKKFLDNTFANQGKAAEAIVSFATMQSAMSVAERNS